MKTCYTCNQEKLESEFSKHNQKQDGLDPNCKVCRSARAKSYYKKNAEVIKSKRAEYYKNNKEKCLKSTLAYQRKLKDVNMHQLLCRRLRNRLYYALKNKNWKKNTKFSKYIGCERGDLVNHLELQFSKGMTWDNYGDWEIDHIVPLSSAKSEEELHRLCHYTNLQPLWKKENRQKGNRIKKGSIALPS